MDNPAFVIELDPKLDLNSNGIKQKEEEVHVYPIEEAISKIGVGKFHYFLLLVCGSCYMAVMVEIMGVSLIMSEAKCDLVFGITEQGLLLSSGFLGVVLSSHAMGFLADTWGRVKTLKYSLALTLVSSVISAFSVSIWMMIVFRFFTGLFISGCQACTFSLLGEFHGKKTRVRHVTLLSTFMPMGLIYLPAIAMVILPIKIEAMVFGFNFSSWRVLLLMDSAMSIVAFIGLSLVPESPKYLLAQGEHDAALEVLKKCYAINSGDSRENYPVKKVVMEISGANFQDVHGFVDAVKLVWNQTAPLFNKERVLTTINIATMCAVIFGISHGTFMWFPMVLNEISANADAGYTVCQSVDSLSRNLANVTSDGTELCQAIDTFSFEVLSYIGVAYMLIYLTFSYVIDKIGKKRLLIGWLILAGLCCLIIHWTTIFFVNIVMLTLTMAVGNCGGILSTISMEYYPTNINAMGMCFIMMIGRLGAVAGSNIIGIILFSNCDMLFYIYAGIIGGLVGMAFFLPSGKPKETAIEAALSVEKEEIEK